MKNNNLISINDLSNEEIFNIIHLTKKIKANKYPYRNIASRFILGNLFFQPSTRTRGSFESAMLHLGGNVINVNDINTTSIVKGEAVQDTIRMWDNYADILVLRHSNENFVKEAQGVSTIPIINAGNGEDEHPTQTLVDLFTIMCEFDTIEHLNFVICGDLKRGRAVHSLIHAALRFNNNIMLVPANGYELSSSFLNNILNQHKGKSLMRDYSSLDKLYPNKKEEIYYIKSHADWSAPYVFYMTRLQNNTPSTDINYPYIDKHLVLDFRNKDLYNNFILMHPLPRHNEIPEHMDENTHSKYFQQAANGVPVRMALIIDMLGTTL